jgi:hypothetical protein
VREEGIVLKHHGCASARRRQVIDRLAYQA